MTPINEQNGDTPQDTDTTKLRGMLKALNALADLDANMPLQMVRALLLVCAEEGIGPNEAARRLGVAGAVTSRHLTDLGEVNRDKEEGYGLILLNHKPESVRRI
jgi:hypothetical protein